jgi:integrase
MARRSKTQDSETRRLQSGLGFLIRYSPNGVWTWRRWDRRRNKRMSECTGELNFTAAKQWVIQRAAVLAAKKAHGKLAPVLFTEVVRAYLDARRKGDRCTRLRPSTLESYQTAIKSFEKFIKPSRYARLPVHQIDARMLTRFIDAEVERGVSAGTANRSFDMIAQVLKFAKKKKLIAANPATEVERLNENWDDEPDDELIRGWSCPTAEELRQIIAACRVGLKPTGQRAYNGSDAGRPVYKGINQNDYTNLYTALSLTGMRIGEARHLTWEDVDFDNSVILIRPAWKNGILWLPKTRSSARRIPIVPDLRPILEEQRETNRHNHWVFETRRGTQLSPHSPTARFRAICDGIGFEKHYVVHSLRKFWASTVAAQGMDAMMMIRAFGHTDFTLIMSTYYAQIDDARLVEAASKIDFGINLGSR